MDQGPRRWPHSSASAFSSILSLTSIGGQIVRILQNAVTLICICHPYTFNSYDMPNFMAYAEVNVSKVAAHDTEIRES